MTFHNLKSDHFLFDWRDIKKPLLFVSIFLDVAIMIIV